jgi:hypothetical protein
MPSLPFCVVPLPFTINNDFGHADAGHPSSHLAEFDTIGMTWKTSSASPPHTIVGDFGSAKTVGFLSMLSANAGSGVTIRLQMGTTTAVSNYDSGYMTFVNPGLTRDDGLYHSHFELPSAQTYRYFAVSVNGQTVFEASTLVLGAKVTPANYYSPGFEFGVEDLGDIDVGRYGVIDETPGRIMRKLNFRLGWMSESDFETKFRPLVEALGKRKVALWCFDPTANVYRQARTYLGWIRNPIVATHVANTGDGPRFQKDLEILSMV